MPDLALSVLTLAVLRSKYLRFAVDDPCKLCISHVQHIWKYLFSGPILACAVCNSSEGLSFYTLSITQRGHSFVVNSV